MKEEETLQIPGPGETPGTLVITHAVYGVLDRAPERTVWYQSKWLRGNLHFRGSQFYLRDLHVYSDRFLQPFLTETVKQHGIEQRLLAVLDGYHWSDDNVRGGHPGRRAQGRFVLIGMDGHETPLVLSGLPTVSQTGFTLQTTVPLEGGGSLVAVFREKDIAFHVDGGPAQTQIGLVFEWMPELSALKDVSANRLNYRYRDFDYSIGIANGTAAKTTDGACVVANGRGPLRLLMAQKS